MKKGGWMLSSDVHVLSRVPLEMLSSNCSPTDVKKIGQKKITVLIKLGIKSFIVSIALLSLTL